MQPLSIPAAVLLLALSTASACSGPSTKGPATTLLRHRHSFFSTLPEEPSDENLKVSLQQVQVLGLNGFREWEVRGSLDSIWKASGKIAKIGSLDTHLKGEVHMQWYDSEAPLLRPPFTPTFIPGLHLDVASEDYASTWNAVCPTLRDLIGGIDCQEATGSTTAEISSKADIRAKDLISIHNHHYIHKSEEPETFRSTSSGLTSLLQKQQQLSGSSDSPVLIDLVLDHHLDVVLKVIWPVGNSNKNKKASESGENRVTILFDERYDEVVEVGWFYREMTEQAHLVHDHYLGATVSMTAAGEEVREALIQTRASVFPPNKRDLASGAIRLQGHGFTSTMTPAQTFHPHSITTIHSNPYIEETTAGCDLHVLQVLPAGIFVDPFQLEGLTPEIGKAVVFGETDLEKPVGVVEGWGSLVMVKVQPEDSSATSRWKPNSSSSSTSESGKSQPASAGKFSATVNIPMHMRYQPPVSEDSDATHVKVAVPWPIVAWACPVDSNVEEIEAKKLFHIPVLPLSLFTSSPEVSKDGTPVEWRFLLPDPIPSHYPDAQVSVPVGRLEDLGVVRAATFALAAAGTLSIAVALVKAVSSRGSVGSKGKRD
ncbi:protease B nonderepressible form [Gryganskiella cystojenkinii]|nr:protease B nonderepressible form [Gryganskiella cystojenkinii]